MKFNSVRYQLNSTLYRNTKSLASSLLYFLLLPNCGFQASVEDQPEDRLRIPGFPSYESNAFNVETQSEFSYDGAILIWNEFTTSGQFSKLAKLADERKILEGKVIEFLKTSYGPAHGSLKSHKARYLQTEKSAVEDQIIRRIEFDRTNMDKLRYNSLAWFEDRLTAFVESEKLTTEQAEESRYKFSYYCEAKLWELASSPYLLGFKYESRPTPMSICEGVYNQKGMFSSTTIAGCGEATSLEGKDYFRCIWEEGVFKSDFWKIKYDDGTAKPIRDRLKELVANGQYAKTMLNNPELFAKVLSRGQFKVGSDTLKPNKASIPVLGKRKLGTWTKFYENLTSRPSSAWRLFSPDADNSEFKAARSALLALGKRDKGDKVVGAVDLIYNSALAVGIIEWTEKDEDAEKRRKNGMLDLPELFGTTDSTLDTILPKFANTLKNISADIDIAQTHFNLLEKVWFNHFDSVIDEKGIETRNVILQQGAAIAIWPQVSFKVQSKDTEVRTILTMTNNKTTPMVGCTGFDPDEIATCSPIDRARLTEIQNESTPVAVENMVFKSESRSFHETIKLPGSEGISNLGFNKNSESQVNSSFSIIPPEHFEFKTLEVKIYPSFISGVRHFTGNIRVFNPDVPDAVSFTGMADLSSYLSQREQLEHQFGFRDQEVDD